MSRATRLQQTLSTALHPDYLRIENESSNHSVPKNAETHFKIVVVSNHFKSLTRIARQRLVHSIIAAEFNTGLHALSMSLHTPEEWQTQEGYVLASPPCHRKTREQ